MYVAITMALKKIPVKDKVNIYILHTIYISNLCDNNVQLKRGTTIRVFCA